MANEDSALREVDRELDEERQREMIQKRGPVLIAGGLAIVLGVAGWQFWNAQQTSFAQSQALEFNEAIELLAADRNAGRDALAAVADEGGGYGVLARFHQAASFSQGGERLRAIEIYRDIYNDGAASRRVKELARLRAAYLSLADGREAVTEDLGSLTQSEGAFGVYALEVSALAALEAEDYETALTMFRSLSVNISAPEPLRVRAEDFAALAASAKAGVNITGDTRVEDLLNALETGAETILDPDADAIDGNADAETSESSDDVQTSAEGAATEEESADEDAEASETAVEETDESENE